MSHFRLASTLTVLTALLAACASAPATSDTGASATSAVSSATTAPAFTGRLVYEWYAGRSAKDIQVWDGGRSRVVAADVEPRASHVHPDVSPDGASIAFESLDDATNKDDIWVVGVDGTGARRLVTCATKGCVQYAFPSWSPRGDELAVLRFDALPNGDWGASAVEVVDLASGKHRELALLPTGDRSFSETPSWSPDGRRLVVQIDAFDAAGDPSEERLAVVSATGPGDQPLTYITPPDAWASYPDWHPTKDLIVFNDHDLGLFQSTDQHSALWTVRPDGSALTRLTAATDVKYAQPTWSPDGDQIVFSVASGSGGQVGSVDLAVTDATGSSVSMLGITGAHARIAPSS